MAQFDLATAISAVLGLLAIILAYHWRRPTLPGYWSDDTAAVRVKTSRFPKLAGFATRAELLPRVELVKSIQKRVQPPGERETTLLYGKRGAGKSTVLWLAFETEPSTVLVSIDQNTDDPNYVYTKMWYALVGDDAQAPSGSDMEQMVWALLRRIKARGDPKPLVVFDLSHSVEGRTLGLVLEQCKRTGYDKGLARFVVEASSARAAHEVDRSPGSFRVEGIIVDDLSRDETVSWTSSLLRADKFGLAVDHARDCAALIEERIGGHILELGAFFRQDLASPPPLPMTRTEWVRAQVEARWEREVRHALKSVKDFMSRAAIQSNFAVGSPNQRWARIRGTEKVRLVFLELAVGTTKDMESLCEALDFGSGLVKREHLVAINAEVARPHPFFMNPFDLTARLSSPALRAAVGRLYPEETTGTGGTGVVP